MAEKTVKNIPEEKEHFSIYNIIMSLPETHLALSKLEENKREEMLSYILGLSNELQKDVNNFKKNLTQEKAQNIIKELVENGKRS
tara:strand:+ start:251 stop:505 length:255 start_codon:yes stop_codon:yes gene_type:complete